MSQSEDEMIRLHLTQPEEGTVFAHVKPARPLVGCNMELVFTVDADGTFSIYSRPVLPRPMSLDN